VLFAFNGLFAGRRTLHFGGVGLSVRPGESLYAHPAGRPWGRDPTTPGARKPDADHRHWRPPQKGRGIAIPTNTPGEKSDEPPGRPPQRFSTQTLARYVPSCRLAPNSTLPDLRSNLVGLSSAGEASCEKSAPDASPGFHGSPHLTEKEGLKKYDQKTSYILETCLPKASFALYQDLWRAKPPIAWAKGMDKISIGRPYC